MCPEPGPPPHPPRAAAAAAGAAIHWLLQLQIYCRLLLLLLLLQVCRRLLPLLLLQGFVYVLDSAGNALEGWPIQMGDVQGQVAVTDLDGDGKPELVAADMRGSVAALRPDGTELWERHLRSQISQVRQRSAGQSRQRQRRWRA